MRALKKTIWNLSTLSALLAASAGCSGGTDDADPASGEVVDREQQAFYYWGANVWSDPNISVCWATTGYATEKKWIRDVIESTYESVTGVNFTSWNECNGGAADVVVKLLNSRWPSAGIGQRAPSSVENVVLNPFHGSPKDTDDEPPTGVSDGIDFGGCWQLNDPAGAAPYTGITGKTAPTGRQNCVERIAVHEFGHILAALHEPDRNDTPASCPGGGGGGFNKYGYWDITSTTNGCNPVYVNDGILSQLDISGLASIYGLRTNDQTWFGVGNVRDYGGLNTDRLLFRTKKESFSATFYPIVGDFDGNGADDIFAYGPGVGADTVYYGLSNRTWSTKATIVNGTYVPAAGDFDGDGKDDIFWHAPGNIADLLWFGQGGQQFTPVATANIQSFSKPLAGDFDGDGRDDIFLYAAGNAAESILFGRADRTFTTVVPPAINTTYTPLVGDFDHDGRSDIFWYQPGIAQDVIWWGKTNRTFASTNITANYSATYVPTVGDFDGNGTSDVLWADQDATEPVWLFSTVRGTYSLTETSSILGTDTAGAASKPFGGDFDGDGVGDVFWYKPN